MRAALLPVLVLLLAMVPATAAALPTPGLFCEPAEAATGRVFPEAMETNDFVSYDEADCGLAWLEAQHPDRVRREVVTKSVGWPSLAGGRDQFDVFVVRVSDYAAPMPVEDRVRVVFQLSIHGNEKGGREGGLRVIEDLAREIGLAETAPHLLDMLGHMELLFVFPNPDGWTHEEVQYRHNDACYVSLTCGDVSSPGTPGLEAQNFVRYNGNGVDVNREWPTVGWVRERYTPMSEPEAVGLVEYLSKETNVRYASDIHGMLNPADGKAPGSDCALGLAFDPTGLDPTCFEHATEGSSGHYVLTMLPGGRQQPAEMEKTTALAELVKERLNADPYFAEWRTVPATEQGYWGGEFNDWGTVWDTLGYTDSGFTSDWYAQDGGLDAPGIDFEFSYNHVTFDNYYPGLAQRMNAYHVQAVRVIVQAFMEKADEELEVTLDAGGTRTAWLESPTLITNEGRLGTRGWAERNAADDAFDAAHKVYRATPNDYFLDLRAHLANGTLEPVRDLRGLSGYDNLVVAGSAYRLLDAPQKASLKAWVEAGGTLLATDEAIRLLEDLGLAKPGSVEVNLTYAGHTNFVDKEHPLARNVRGLARQTYEPVPLGYNLSASNAPVWHVDANALAQGVEVVGVAGTGQGAEPNPSWADLGVAKLGEGRVVFLGALLPDPTDQDAAFYGVDSYATTYTGNQLVRNALGWEMRAQATPLDLASLGPRAPATGDDASVPAPGLALVAVALVGAALVLRRR